VSVRRALPTRWPRRSMAFSANPRRECTVTRAQVANGFWYEIVQVGSPTLALICGNAGDEPCTSVGSTGSCNVRAIAGRESECFSARGIARKSSQRLRQPGSPSGHRVVMREPGHVSGSHSPCLSTISRAQGLGDEKPSALRRGAPSRGQVSAVSRLGAACRRVSPMPPTPPSPACCRCAT